MQSQETRLSYPRSLRALVFTTTGQDLRRCSHCAACDGVALPEMDLTLESLMQLVVFNDDEALTSRTLWSEPVLAQAEQACPNGLNLPRIMLALRGEAARRGLGPEYVQDTQQGCAS